MKYNSNRGNALFLILIAVVLLGALSFAVTQSDRGGADSMKEQRSLSSAQLTQIGASLEAAVTRMRVSGILAADIQMHIAGDLKTPCTAGVNCLFAPEGGDADVPYMPPNIEKGNAPAPYARYFEVADNGYKTGINNDQPILILTVRNINRETCKNINKGLGLSGVGNALLNAIDAGRVLDYSGKLAGCVATQGLSDDSTYFHVLSVQ